MKLDLKHSLSLKLLRVVLLSALIVGLVLSCAQIVFDSYKTRQTVANDAQRILAMFSDPSTQAVYSLDREMGLQVIEGLFQNDSVRYAAIGHPNEPVLAEKSRPLLDIESRSHQGAGHIDLPMSRYDIADHLGLTAETVSRVLTSFRKRRIIANQGLHCVRLLDRDALEGQACDGGE